MKGYCSYVGLRKARDKVRLSGGGSSDDDIFDYYEQNPVIRTAIRVVRYMAPEISEFTSDLLSCKAIVPVLPKLAISSNNMLDVPIFWDKKDPEYVYVVPNISLDYWQPDEAATFSPWVGAPFMLRQFGETLKQKLANPATAKGYFNEQGHPRRGMQRVRIVERMMLSRALPRYTKLAKSSESVAKIVVEMVARRRPLEIQFSRSPEDFIIMYKSGPSSCMRVDKAEKAWGDLLAVNHAPASFYHYHPRAKGAWLANAAGDIRCRCIMWQLDDQKWYYGRVYDCDNSGVEFKRALEKQGIRALPSGAFRTDELIEFEIPGIMNKANGQWCFPMPYVDNPGGYLRADFDEKTNVFKFAHYGNTEHVRRSNKGGSKHMANVNWQQTNGFVLQSQVVKVECHKCGRAINGGNFCPSTNLRYCGPECYTQDGLISARRSDNAAVLIPEGEAFPDALDDNYFYTNEAAAQTLGAIEVSGLYTHYENAGISTRGVTVKDATGALHRISSGVFERIAQRNSAHFKEVMITPAIRGWESKESKLKIWPWHDKIKVAKQVAVEADFLTKPMLEIKGRWPDTPPVIEQRNLKNLYAFAGTIPIMISDRIAPFTNDGFVVTE